MHRLRVARLPSLPSAPTRFPTALSSSTLKRRFYVALVRTLVVRHLTSVYLAKLPTKHREISFIYTASPEWGRFGRVDWCRRRRYRHPPLATSCFLKFTLLLTPDPPNGFME